MPCSDVPAIYGVFASQQKQILLRSVSMGVDLIHHLITGTACVDRSRTTLFSSVFRAVGCGALCVGTRTSVRMDLDQSCRSDSRFTQVGIASSVHLKHVTLVSQSSHRSL